ncbi:MAG: class I SAM-dependent methyltransferase [Acidobacteria bacterium]|nr:MAG: class I SAM-dependent methyltransferase [Acidobacteriota bacterium]
MKLDCRFCGASLRHVFLDLGMSPLANSYVKAEDLNKPEKFYPLCVYICEACFLVQLPECESPDQIFSDYAYFSSFSASWLQHARDYTGMVIDRLKLDKFSRVVEIASNDGYLLQYFVEKGIPCYGVEPARNVASAAIDRGVPTVVEFFSTQKAEELKSQGKEADLVIGNNVLAHVPRLNDFVEGLKVLLKPSGTITMEFPHLLRLMEENQFDTIYHEHYSYFSLFTVRRIFASHGLTLYDVERLSTHGGSLRIYGCHTGQEPAKVSAQVSELLSLEEEAGLTQLNTYVQFRQKVLDTKIGLVEFLISAKRRGKKVAAYGAPAKGNTLLNVCGIRSDLIDYTVDLSPHKQGLYLPGTHIPIYAPNEVGRTRPDYLLILPWNLRREITEQMSFIREWGGQFVVPVPQLEIIADASARATG